MKRTELLTRGMSVKTIAGWAAIAFIVWWVIEQPASAAYLEHNIDVFLSTAAAGLSAFFASMPIWMAVIPVLAVALVTVLVLIRRLAQSARRRKPSTATTRHMGLTRFSARLTGLLRDHTKEGWLAKIPSLANAGLVGETSSFIGHETSAGGSDERITFADQLVALAPGRVDCVEYQRLCQETFENLFCPPLDSPLRENGDLSRMNRRDFILPNHARKGPWHYLRQRYNADFIVVECKNLTAKVGKKDVLQVANYLKPKGVGLLAIITCRNGAAPAALNTVRDQWLEHHKMIIILQDADMLQMVAHKASGGDPVELIVKKIQDFRLSI